MAEQKMLIEIGQDGQISVDLDGFKGKGCAAIIDLMEEIIGPAVRKNKPEYDTKAGSRLQADATVKTKR